MTESASLSSGDRASAFIGDPTIAVPPIPELGELPVVQDHFQAVLKRRLQVEISQNPPLFPWESNLSEYPTELSARDAMPWLSQLRSLPLPTSLPDDILTGLLSRCQEIVAESLQPGIQLVKAVETLFPDQPQTMNQIAGLVLANASVRSAATRNSEALKAAFPEGYEGANPQQQVTLTMLAAKDILDTLTVNLTAAVPMARREWQVADGTVILTAQYDAAANRIDVTVDAPQASQLSVPTLDLTAQQDAAGPLSLTIENVDRAIAYPLEIRVGDAVTTPLTFALRVVDNA